jgi:hypothetical protein
MSDDNDNRPPEMSETPHETEVMTTYADTDDDFSAYDEFGDEAGLPGRPRRVVVNRYTAALAALVIGGACFYAGVRVEKSQVSSTSGTAASGLSALASRFGAASGSASGATSRRTAGGAGFAAGGFGGGAPGDAAGGGATSGTIATINGDTLDVTETSGNTVKVKLSDATTLTKTVSVSKKSLFPGDTVSVTGSAGSGGTVTATALSDSGSGSGSGTSSSASSSTGSTPSSSSGSTALNSLFGGG